MDKERKDLANFISLITQDKTPFMSSISEEEATTIYHEWQTDTLGTPSSFNVIGPDDSRLSNFTWMDGKTIAVSGTTRAVDQAGIKDEYAYQLKKRGVSIRRFVGDK